MLRVPALAGASAAYAAGKIHLWRRQARVMMQRPTSEWTFTHMNRLFPSTTVDRGGPCAQFRPPAQPLQVQYRFDGRTYDLDQLHLRTYSTGFVVLHKGNLVHESYQGLFAGPQVRFQLFSLTKSITSILVGIALDNRILVDTSDGVIRYLPQLAGSAYDAVSIDHLLDMTSGVGTPELWTDPDSDIARFADAVFTGGSLEAVVRSVERFTQPGVTFNYSTIDTQVLGWILEAASGESLAEFASKWLWSRIGADHDAYYWLSRERPRTAIGGGSFNATARDLARIGLLMSHGGMIGGRQIVSREWVERSWQGVKPHLEKGALGRNQPSHYGYANHWWTVKGGSRTFAALGIYGQYLYVDSDADVVIAKCSAWPVEDDAQLDRETIIALNSVVCHLEGRSDIGRALPAGLDNPDHAAPGWLGSPEE
jgi:CubicO group peptidase (beta-lactamase class C family)